MEMYVYYSIVIFGTIIISLYIYIIWVKLSERYTYKKERRYQFLLVPLIDSIVGDFMHNPDIDLKEQTALISKHCKNKLKKRVVEDRMIYHLETLKNTSKDSLIHLCEKIGIIQLELDHLSKKNIYGKALACKRLGELRSKDAIPYLLDAINSSSQDVDYNALLALAKIGDESAFLKAFEAVNSAILLSERSLIEIVDSFEGNKASVYSKMIHSDNEFVSCIFIKSAGSFMNDELASQIAPLLQSTSKEKTISAIKSLENMKNSAYKEDLKTLLTNDSWEIRSMAARALGSYPDEDVIDSLIDALSDAQWFVRSNAAKSLLILDRDLNYITKVFEGTDKFAKDILIATLESDPQFSHLLSDDCASADCFGQAALLIKNYILQGDKNE